MVADLPRLVLFCRSLTQRWGVAWVSGLVFFCYNISATSRVSGLSEESRQGVCLRFCLFRTWPHGSRGLGDLLVGGDLPVPFMLSLGGRCCCNDGLDGRWLASQSCCHGRRVDFGGLLSLLGVIPGLLLGRGRGGNWIEARVYVFEKQHHLVFSSFQTVWPVSRGLFVSG